MQPSLRDQRDYYLERANDPIVPMRERVLWQQLADELSLRLNDEPDVTQMELF